MDRGGEELMATHVTENDKIIENAFSRLAATEDELITSGLRKMLKDGMNIALQLHDAEHLHHIEMGDSYGWILWHNGDVVDMEVKAKHHTGSSVEWQMRTIPAVVKEGWCGAIVAGMLPTHYFAYDYEIGILETTIDLVKENFHYYFKRV